MAIDHESDEFFDRALAAERKKRKGDDTDSKQLVKELLPELGNFEDKPPQEPPATEPEGATEALPATPIAEEAEKPVEAVTEPSEEDKAKEAKDWLESLPEEAKAEVQKLIDERRKLEHRIASDDGRVNSYQRLYEQQKREAAEAKARAEELAKKVQAPAKPNEIPKHIKDVLETDKEFGEVLLAEHNERIKERLELEQRLEQLAQQASQFQTVQERVEIYEARQVLEQERPGSLQLIDHPIWEDFKTALGQNPATRHLVAMANSRNPLEVAMIVDLYPQWISQPDAQEYASKKYGAPAQDAAGDKAMQTAATPTPPDKIAQAQKVQAERARKQQAAPVATAAVGRPTQMPTAEQVNSNERLYDDVFENNLKYFREQARKRSMR